MGNLLESEYLERILPLDMDCQANRERANSMNIHSREQNGK